VIINAFAGLFSRAMDRGEIERSDSMILSHLFVSPFIKTALWRLAFGGYEDAKSPRAGDVLRTHVRHFLKSVSLSSPSEKG